MLRSIRSTNSLSTLSTIYLHDSKEFVDTLIGLRALSELKISHVHGKESRASLLRLLENYRLRSMAESSQLLPSLTYAVLCHCDAISDDLLLKLATFTALHRIRLCDLKNITTNGVYNVIIKLSDRLTSLELEEMDLMADKIIISLGEFKKLSYLKLESLKNVTDQGIYGLLDTINPLILKKMSVKNCANITKSCIAISKQKIKVVDHT